MTVDIKYRTTATATTGPNARTRTDDGAVDVALTTPRELGGPGGEGSNPEQLFAAAYAACFLSSMKAAAVPLSLHVPDDTTVTANLGIGLRPGGGYGLTVDIKVSAPGLGPDEAQRLVDQAYETWPYSNATPDNLKLAVALA